jgi:hypothetical protein
MTVALELLLALGSLLAGATQVFLILKFIKPQSWREARNRLRGLQYFWRAALSFAVVIVVLLLLAVITGFLCDQSARQRDQATDTIDLAAAERALKESQVHEFLEMYRDPKKANEADLQRYWLLGSEALSDVKTCLSRLLKSGEHYGAGSRLLTFEFRYGLLFGDRAEIGTREHWLLFLVHSDGSAVRERNVDLGPYELEYTLRKVKGVWLVESTTTPYIHKVH